jgi:Flp pilus assembly protein TadG
VTRLAPREWADADRSEAGVVAVFTVIVLFVLLAVAALVLDLGGLRVQREHDRGAADLAATAGAQSLSTSEGVDMVGACNDAWTYTLANLSNTSPAGSMPCNNFATTCSPTVARAATATAGAFTVTITNPVPDTSALMGGSHTIGGATQALDPSVDGNACQRIGVTIAHTRSSVFAQIFGTRSSTTTTSSVALALLGTTQGQAPGLLILEPSACNALVASGQGNIEVQANGDAPGLIAVDSSGTGGSGGNNCSTGGRYAIDASGTQNSSIIADASLSSGAPGVIDLYALASGQGNTHAYDPSDVPSRVSPLPQAELAPATRSPLDFKYNCTAAGYDGVLGTTDDCSAATSTSDYINQLHRLYDTSSPWNAPTVPTVPTLFSTYPRPGVAGDTCSPNGAAIVLPAGNWYVKCPSGFSVSNDFTIGAGNVVFAGAVNAQGGSLTIGSAATSTTIVYIRSGDLTKTAQAALTLNNTTVLLQSGAVNLGGGSGPLTWSAPRDPTSPYDDLALWAESANAQSMGAQTTLNLDGVFFMPNSAFTFSGQGSQYQTTAQFVSRTLTATGQGTLRIKPDPVRGFKIPNVGNHLIR